jgi:CubicO group peptidase (beta-lactamase class C family)
LISDLTRAKFFSMRVDKSVIGARAEAAIHDHVFPGCVIGIFTAETGYEVLPYGAYTYTPDAPRVTRESLYDVASITKSIPVAALATLLIEAKNIALKDLVRAHLPELQNDHDATIEDLLRYRVQGPRFSTLNFQTATDLRAHILACGFSTAAGEHQYSNMPAYILGLVLEKVTGKSLDTLAKDLLFDPLGMSNSTFFPTAACIPTEIDASGNEICGIVHDESARVFACAGQASGHAGLFSTAGDLLRFAAAMLENRLPAALDGAEAGLGWSLQQPWFMGSGCGPRTFGKTGFTGTSIVADKEKGKALVILSNRIYPTRPADAGLRASVINAFRAEIADIVFA